MEDTSIATQAASTQPNQPHRGGRVACAFCHTRRVRCNAYDSRPCSNCASAKVSCQLIESKRGRYARSRTKTSQAVVSGNQDLSDHASAATIPLGVQCSPSRRPLDALPNPTQTNDGRSLSSKRLDVGIYTSQFRAESHTFSKEGSENLYARLSEQSVPLPETRSVPGGQSLYLGESWLLTYVVQKVINADTVSDASSTTTLQVPLPATVSDKPDNLGYDTRIDSEEIEILNIRGAFVLPERPVSDKLIRTFFECVYPAFPIFDRTQFAQLYELNQLPHIILHAIYAVSSTMCSEDVIVETGFENRNAARKIFLKRAKALHDADYETNKVTLVQAAFLLSFLWSGSTDEKDMFYWLSIAIGNAQGKGMHRTTQNSTLTLRDRRLWKRIWWSLYVRDRHCSANIGRPMRIRDDDNDVEPLEDSDFEDDIVQGRNTSSIFGNSSKIHVLYTIAMSRLSVIFGAITLAKFSTKKSSHGLSHKELSDQLSEWYRQLPPELQDGDGDEDGGFWPKMLELNYNQQLILLHRPESCKIIVDKKLLKSPAFTATKKISAIIDDFLALGLLRKSQLQICPSLFSALTMYVLMARSPDHMQRKLAEHKARLLLLACSEIAKTWPACSWIMMLFETIFRNLEKRNNAQVPQVSRGGGSQWEAPLEEGTAPRAPQDTHRESQHEQISLSSFQGQTAPSPQPNVFYTEMLSDMPLHDQFVNIPEFFDQDLLSGLPQDFGLAHDVFPYLMES